ncbi:MAG: MGMT family protein [Candidatus Dojkabacteria bacterium]
MTSQISNSVYKLLRTIPKGKVVTYGMISNFLSVRSPRAVGRILHNNPDEANPCHRVVFADGSLSETFAFGGSAEHRARLEAEGVTFQGSKVDLSKHIHNF